MVLGAQQQVRKEPNSCWFSVGNWCEHIKKGIKSRLRENKGIKSRLREKKGLLYATPVRARLGVRG